MQTFLPSAAKTGQRLLVLGLLLLIPLLLFITSLQTIQSRDKVWYGAGYDPEYAYLFNSLNVATFRLVGHFDHPGTPMQVYGALILQGSWLFHRNGESLTQEVLSHPEFYLRIMSVATAILAALAVFIAGVFILRRTGSFWYALVLQSIPFISGFILYNAFARFTQETMLMIAALALAASVVDWLINATPAKENSYAAAFGIISGFGMAAKILFAPLLIIPLVLLTTFKTRKRYLAFTGGAFVIFTLPVVMLYPNMAWWIIKLFVFTGQYGSGSVGLLDTFSYPKNFWWTLKIDPTLAILTAIGLIWLAVQFVRNRPGKALLTTKSFKLVASVTAAIVLGYIVVAKQPKESYLLPYEMIAAVLFILLLFETGKFGINRDVRRWAPAMLSLVMAGIIIPSGLAAKKKIYSPDKNHIWETSWLAAGSISENSIMVFAHPGSSPMAALFFGNAYSHWRYADRLRHLYPDTYLYNLVEKKIVDWDNTPIDEASLRQNENRILIQGTVEDMQAIHQGLTASGIRIQAVPFYKDEKQILMIASSEKDVSLTRKKSLIFSSAETRRDDEELPAAAAGIKIHGRIDFLKSHNGINSIITDAESPYAFTTKDILLQPGDEIRARVYASGKQKTLQMVVSESGTNNVLMRSPPNSGKDENWMQHKVTFVNTTDSALEIFIYCLNASKSSGWFDDFSVEITNSIQP